MSGEKTEKPTAKKNKENRKEGKVPRSQEVGAWAALLLFAGVIPKLLGHEIGVLEELMATCLSSAGEADVSLAFELLGRGLTHVLLALLLLGAGVMLVSVAGALAQGGFFLATKSLKPKLSKINPLAGFKRMFGMRLLWDGAKMLLKSGLVAFLVWMSIKAMLPYVGGMVPMDAVINGFADNALGMLRNVALIGVLLALADYGFQRHKTGKQTKMSKEDIKQEHKQSDGDPLLKGAIRSRQLAMARNRMMADIPTADVVLVNPTHFAVALKYDAEKGAPRVVARGAGVIAQNIREKATDAEVPLVRDVPLARALYHSTTVGQEIPVELFGAVAQVLAFVISRRTKGQRGGEHKSPRIDAPLPEVARPGRRNASDQVSASR
ncbi:flagellar biosynthesis protein FlhB [Nocardioides sp. SR21]|uniref:EscU/YscU/HrcU family type III secretion system export apparatus switch protein n=1 Tax=Nocardioides sp. SR21 TaxID=2919501 RepID=UPI001FAA28A3|nr:EscU/YscU/HrcU family type III secretion system export apparatus switch protein [Nocardioides sp. SR21]